MSFRVPSGFRLAGVHCGIKKLSATEDLTLLVADQSAVAAGVYTQNLVYAAPVAWDRERTPSESIRVLIVNSGNANACTGERGMQDAREMARLAASTCEATADQALVMSTGIIGEFLPMERISRGVQLATAALGSDESHLMAAARGITTTDRGPKVAGRSVSIAGRSLAVTGFAKGAGMIGPRMATMLGVVMTDARLTVADAQQCLHAAVAKSFNCISVEGHMSTNDTVVLLASGAASSAPLARADLNQFQETLEQVCIELAKMIPDDGEGASHLVTIDIRGCFSEAAAQQIARTIAGSALVKTAIAGGDPNWGRIVSAAGYAGVPFQPQRLRLRVNGHLLYENGAPVRFDAAVVSASMKDNRDTHVELEFAEGSAATRFWTSDLNHEYIRVNADYHT